MAGYIYNDLLYVHTCTYINIFANMYKTVYTHEHIFAAQQILECHSHSSQHTKPSRTCLQETLLCTVLRCCDLVLNGLFLTQLADLQTSLTLMKQHVL